MKKAALFLMLCGTLIGAKAQSCDSILLARFNYDVDLIASYPMHKLGFYCAFAQSAFYVSDELPKGAAVFPITEVKNLYTGEYLPANYVVDLEKVNYYAYNFEEFQHKFPTGEQTICFHTPASAHKYLVLRSYDDAHMLAVEKTENVIYDDEK